MKKKLSVKLLGKCQVRYGNEPISELVNSRLTDLFAYLILNRKSPQTRQQISYLLWPERTEKQAFANLRQLLFRLRKILPGNFILADPDTIRWNPASHYSLDVADFERHVKNATKLSAQKENPQFEYHLETAAAFYHGRLLTNCYQEWIDPIREKLHRNYLWVLEQLAELFEEKREYSRAIEITRKLLNEDPYEESFYRTLMRLYLLTDDRAKAMLAYRECEDILRQELDIKPGKETAAFFHQLQSTGESGQSKVVADSQHAQGPHVRMVGRQIEWKRLLNSWKEILAGTTNAVVISGEAGIGKTRLAQEFLCYVKKQGYAADYAKSYKAGEAISYGPIIEWLRSDLKRGRLEKLDKVWSTELGRLIPELDQPKEPLSPGTSRGDSDQHRLFEAIRKSLTARNNPRLLMLDDLQWCDSETLDWLNFLFHSECDDRLLVVGMIRPVEARSNVLLQTLLANIEREGRLTRLTLEELNQEETAELASLVANRALDAELEEYIFTESEGNPLFIIETVREGGLPKPTADSATFRKSALPADASPMPQKITEIILARLNRLSEGGKEVIGLASSVGREFYMDIISVIYDGSYYDLMKIIDELLDHQIIQEVQAGVFDFTHDKIREVAYRHLSETKRTWLHKQFADLMVRYEGTGFKANHANIAYHFVRAGEFEHGIHHYLLAAEEEQGILSKRDTGYYREALNLIERVSDHKRREQIEYEILKKLALSLVHIRGNNPEEISCINKRVRTLAEKLDLLPSAPELFTLSMESLLKGNLKDCEATSREMFARSGETGDALAHVQACYLLGGLELYVKGNAGESYRYYREGLKAYDPSQHLRYMRKYDLDGGIVLNAGLTSYYLITCRINEARRMLRKTFRTALSTQSIFTVVYVNFMLAWWHMLCQKPRSAQKAIEKFVEYEINYELFHWNTHSKVMLGWSLAHQHHLHKGIKLMRGGIDELKTHAFIPDLPYYFGKLAELLGVRGDLREAFSLIDQALEFTDRTGVRFPESELYRIKGDLLVTENPKNRDAAIKAYKKGLSTAKKQGFKIFEDRISTALNQLKH